MKRLTCEMCGGTELIKEDGVFVCQTCGTKYSAEEAKKMMVEGTVDVQGTVKVDNSAFVEKYLANARSAKQKEDWKETEKYYNMVEQNDPTNIEAIFYSTFAQVKLALLEAETKDKRQSIFNVLIKSVSIIDDNYDNTSEEYQKLLFEIMDDIKGLKEGTIVPTTHLADYVTKNGYGNIVDLNQIVENDSLNTTYGMIDKVFEAYMDSLANIIIEHSPESVKELFLQNITNLNMFSSIHDKVAPHIDGYKMPKDAINEIAEQVKIDEETTKEDINKQVNELAETICPFYMVVSESTNERFLTRNYSDIVWVELRKLYPEFEVLNNSDDSDNSGCYVATAVYGSYDCPQVWTLRRYRDYSLAETWYGRAFIHTYYAISPTLVKWFGHTEWFKKMWKGKLDKMVKNLQEQGFESTPYEDRNWR